MAVTLACSRYRARDFRLLALIRRIASLSLCRGVKLHFRWVPSEFNAADHGSRVYAPGHETDTSLINRLLPDVALKSCMGNPHVSVPQRDEPEGSQEEVDTVAGRHHPERDRAAEEEGGDSLEAGGGSEFEPAGPAEAGSDKAEALNKSRVADRAAR